MSQKKILKFLVLLIDGLLLILLPILAKLDLGLAHKLSVVMGDGVKVP